MLLNETNFQEETKEGLVVVDFYTDSCQPCKMLAPVLGLVTGAKICKVNAAVETGLCAEFAISAVPTLLFFKDGQKVDKSVGFVNQSALQAKIDKLK